MRDNIINVINKSLIAHKDYFLQEIELQVFLFNELKRGFPKATVYLEYPIISSNNSTQGKESVGYIDLVVKSDDLFFPIELKFKTKNQVIATNYFGNKIPYTLKDQTAYNLSCYGFWADIARMEGLSKILPSKVQRGIGVFVTNDGSYKEGPRESAGYANFSLHECREISAGQSLKWNRKKKFKSKLKNIQIQNACKISWHDMDNLPNHMFCII
jgi:hypothetical protein